jgi:hypothetical protein
MTTLEKKIMEIYFEIPLEDREKIQDFINNLAKKLVE